MPEAVLWCRLTLMQMTLMILGVAMAFFLPPWSTSSWTQALGLMDPRARGFSQAWLDWMFLIRAWLALRDCNSTCSSTPSCVAVVLAFFGDDDLAWRLVTSYFRFQMWLLPEEFAAVLSVCFCAGQDSSALPSTCTGVMTLPGNFLHMSHEKKIKPYKIIYRLLFWLPRFYMVII